MKRPIGRESCSAFCLPCCCLAGPPEAVAVRPALIPEEETVAIEHVRLRELHPAVARRVLRAASAPPRRTAQLRAHRTDAGDDWAGPSRGGKFDLGGGITVERSLREIRLTRSSTLPKPGPEHEFLIPGEIRCSRVRGVSARRVGSNAACNLKDLESRGSGNTSAQPESQESCRGAGPAARDWRGAEKLAGGGVGGKNCVDARGRGRGAGVSVYHPVPA